MVEPMGHAGAKSPPPRCGRFIGRLSLALVAAAAASIGCQSFAPASLGRISGVHADRKIAKQAAAEHFPSPADVGLAPATAP